MGTHPIFESDFDCLTEGKMSDFNLDQLGNPNAMMAGAAALTQDANSYTNTQDVEAVWAARAFQQAEVHMKLLKAVGPARMKFSKMDEDLMKGTDERKKQWREWCNQYEKSVQDYNFGTLLRVDPDEDYTQENTIFCLRVQFLAIEIARNKEGLNKKICEKKPQTGGCCSRC